MSATRNLPESTTAHDILVGARKLIERPQQWVQGSWARTAGGKKVSYRDSSATCFCLASAVRAAGYGYGNTIAAIQTLAKHTPGNIIKFNDAAWTRHEDVLRVLDAAIAEEAGR